MPHPATFARITPDDIAELATLVTDSFARYREFAPPGWRPPARAAHLDALRRWMGEPDFWGELAREQRALIGHATVVPAGRHSVRADPDPAVAHLGHLFVQPRHWGSGVADQLLSHALAAAAQRGHTAMRLFVPVGQARARGFYAREGFAALGEPFDPGLGLPVLEYRRRL